MVETYTRELLRDGRILLFGEIDADLSEVVFEQLCFCELSKITPTVYICSDGGDLDCAAGLVDKILELEANTFVVGKAYSAAAIIAAAGYDRATSINSYLMFHPCSYVGEEDHNKHKSYVEFSDKAHELLYRTICSNCGMTTRQSTGFIKRVDQTLWLTAREAKKQKIITTIIGD